MRRFLVGIASALALAWVLVSQVVAQEQVTVFAAASLRDALETAAKPFTASTGVRVRFSFAASSALARQIEQGADADLFASADLDWMDYLAQRKLVHSETRRNLLGNTLVVIAPKELRLIDFKLDTGSLKAALGTDGRLATGEVSSVPVGKYAKIALENLGLWATVNPRLAMTDNVRAALILVARGEAPLGIVYATDAAAEPRVKVVATFPGDSHPPIIYPFALTASTKSDGAAKFLEYIESPAARPFFEAQGFTVLSSESQGTRQ